jgi:hypothetical protein
MRIFFNRKPVEGPWGGGSKVLKSIVEECISRNHTVRFSNDPPEDKRFDILFCMDPRSECGLSYLDLVDKRRIEGSLIVQRIGDLGTHGKPDLTSLVRQTSSLSDVLIFPSEWSKNILKSRTSSRVIHNAPLDCFFNSNRLKKSPSEKLRIVTHHWSNNVMKGFDVYRELDKFCRNSNDFEFTFIGRCPQDVQLTNHIQPLDASGLVHELQRHHIYLTASKQEAGANHVLEAMAMGLPVLYHEDGGSINEYCEGRGSIYGNFEELKQILRDDRKVEGLLSSFESYSRNSTTMAKEYVDFLESL